MNFNQIETFIAVAEAGSFTKAAQKQYISPQALMQQIGTLEKHLGFKLFIRNSKGVRLSPGGEAYYEGVKKLLSQYQDLGKRSYEAAHKATSLRIGLPDNVNPSFLLSICKNFSERYPEVKIGYEIVPRWETAKAIQQGRADICAQISLDEDMPFYCEKLFPVMQYCIISKNHPLAKKTYVSVEELAGCVIGFWDTMATYKHLIKHMSENCIEAQFQNLQGIISDALVFCMEGNVLLTSVPVVNHFKSTMVIVPLHFDCDIYYSIIFMENDNQAVNDFLLVAKEAACAENHPWEVSLKEYYGVKGFAQMPD